MLTTEVLLDELELELELEELELDELEELEDSEVCSSMTSCREVRVCKLHPVAVNVNNPHRIKGSSLFKMISPFL